MMLLCCACLHSVGLVLVEILVSPEHDILIFKWLITCTQVAHSFINVRVHKNAQCVVRDQPIRDVLLLNIVSTQSVQTLHHQFSVKIWLPWRWLLLLVDSVTFVVCLVEVFPGSGTLAILVKQCLVNAWLLLLLLLLLLLILLDGLLLLLLIQKWWSLFAYHSSDSTPWDFHEVLCHLLILCMIANEIVWVALARACCHDINGLVGISHVSTFGSCRGLIWTGILHSSQILLLLGHPVSHEGSWIAGCLPGVTLAGQSPSRLLLNGLVVEHVCVLLVHRHSPSVVLDALVGYCLVRLVRDESTCTWVRLPRWSTYWRWVLSSRIIIMIIGHELALILDELSIDSLSSLIIIVGQVWIDLLRLIAIEWSEVVVLGGT